MSFVRAAVIAFALTMPLPVLAETSISLGTIQADASAPVEVEAESLTINQENGSAVFSGDVLIKQGDLRIAGGQVEVHYDAATGDVVRLIATGGVTFTTQTDAAKADAATYDLTARSVVLTGNVIITQGASTIAAERMVVNIDTGAAQLDGRVRTTLTQGNN